MKIDTLKQKKLRALVVGICITTGIIASTPSYALDIDAVTNKVRQTLATRGSESKYQALCAAYNTQIKKIESFLTDFLNRNNKTPAQAFLGRLDSDLKEFDTLILHPIHTDDYLRGQLHADVHALHHQFRELYAMLVANIKTKSGWVLAPKLLPYKNLIPGEIRDRYNDPMIVINALNHRLKCA